MKGNRVADRCSVRNAKKKARAGKKYVPRGLVEVPVSVGNLNFVGVSEDISLNEIQKGNKFVFSAEKAISAENEGVGGWPEAATESQ